jgi:hypothetical protein
MWPPSTVVSDTSCAARRGYSDKSRKRRRAKPAEALLKSEGPSPSVLTSRLKGGVLRRR